MDSFFLSYCSVCDKSLDSLTGLYCSEECRLRDACDKNSPIVHTHGHAPKTPSKQLNYPSVLKCPHRHCYEPSNVEHTHLSYTPSLHSNPMTALSRVEAFSMSSTIPDLSLSEDDESATEDWDVPALSLDDRVYPVPAH